MAFAGLPQVGLATALVPAQDCMELALLTADCSRLTARVSPLSIFFPFDTGWQHSLPWLLVAWAQSRVESLADPQCACHVTEK